MDRVERVARAMCKADGTDPDLRIPTGRMETVALPSGGMERREQTKAAWQDYEREARRFVAAFDAVGEAMVP
jgi:hypothetical protein